MRRQWAALNVTVIEPEGQQRPAEREGLPVWSSNWPALIALLDCSTQWRTAVGTGGVVYFGLDYTACKAMLGGKLWRKVRADLGVMEAHALPILNGGEAPVDRRSS